MKNIKRIVNIGFWNDEKVLEDFSPEDKYFMLYLLTNPYTTQLGVYYLPIKKAALEMGYSREAIIVLIERFETKYKIIKFNYETSEVAILNFLKHSIIKGGKPVMDCLVKEEKNIKDKSLVYFVCKHLSEMDSELILPTVSEFVNTFLDKYNSLTESNNNNDNDNENERNANVTCNVTYPVTSSIKQDIVKEDLKEAKAKHFVKPTVEEVAAYCKERNNGIDAQHFYDYQESRGWVLSNGKKMQDWKATVRTWEHNGKKYSSQKQQSTNRKYCDNKNEDDLSDLWS